MRAGRHTEARGPRVSTTDPALGRPGHGQEGPTVEDDDVAEAQTTKAVPGVAFAFEPNQTSTTWRCLCSHGEWHIEHVRDKTQFKAQCVKPYIRFLPHP